MDRLAWLNGLPPEQAETEFLTCCGARAWARAMAAARPFTDDAMLLGHADNVWRGLAEQDWLEAFRAHPRIGEEERSTAAASDAPAAQPSRGTHAERAARWPEQEQAGARAPAAGVRAALARGNRLYEHRFGHIFLIRAAGRGAEEMLASLKARLANDPVTELRVAAEEQRQITRIRLERLLTP